VGELKEKLKEKLDPKRVAARSADQWNHYCSLGLKGETRAKKALRTTPADITTQATAIAITHATLLVLLVDQDRVRELPAIFPRPSFQWPSYWAVNSPRLRSSLF
jgi:hypothetical protein